MKFSALGIAAVALATLYGGSVLAQSAAPVTMQPIANPPEKAAKPHAHKGKHHAKPAAKTDAPAPSAK